MVLGLAFIILLVSLIILIACPQVSEKPLLLILISLMVFVPLIYGLNQSLIKSNNHRTTDKERLEKYIKNKKQHKCNNTKTI